MMKLFSKLICVLSSLLLFNGLAIARDHPEAHFGEYGIKHHPSLSGYTKYIGKTVMYMPEYEPSYDDKNSSFALKGKMNTPFVITKITGTDSRMTFHMREQGGKTKVKMVINNQHEYYSYGKYTYCISGKGYNQYTVPLVLVDELEKKKQECVGKIIADKYEIVDFAMEYPEKKGYPVPCYIIKNKESNDRFAISEDSNIYMLGYVYTHPLVKASYEVVGLIRYKEYDWQSKSEDGYRVRNSETGELLNVAAKSANVDCFKKDLSGRYYSTLMQVEKPIDSENRYGETKTIEDEGITKFSYVDEIIDIIIYATSSQFNFELKNVSQSSIKVIWNEAVFVDSDGSTSKVMHVGTKYSEREGDQPPTTIIKGAKIDDLAVPTKNVRYSDVLKEWVTDSMYPSTPALNVDPIRLMLPIQVKDTINEYIFVFEVKYSYDHPERLNL